MNKCIPCTIASAVVCLAAVASTAQDNAGPVSEKVAIKVDASKEVGPVKPVNGVGQPPLYGKVDTRYFHYLTEAGIPFSRLHDVGGGYGGFVFVDIPNVFRDFDADETDPASYDFTFTDLLLSALDKAGVKPFYRLGVTIENYANIKAYRVFPPKDFDKWARICERIVAHYNDGWADGFHFGIEYWEVWNEADIGGSMWRDSYGEYIRLYTTTAKYLKSKFPDIKVGGPSSYDLKALVGDASAPSAPSLECARDFLRAVKKENAPLDFFSFHCHADLDRVLAEITAVRKFLDDEGFPGLKICLEDWQTIGDVREIRSPEHTAMVGASLLALQASEVDSAALYNAKNTRSVFSPIFDLWKPVKGYYAFRSFHELRKLGNAVEATSSRKDVYVGAAAKDGKLAVMIVNTTDKAIPYEIEGFGELPPNCRVTNGKPSYDFKNTKLPTELSPYSITVIAK